MTARNFGINRGRQRLSGASSTLPSAYSAETRADPVPLVLFPTDSLPESGPEFEGFDFSHSMRNIERVLIPIFGTIAILCALFICFFVDTSPY